jgi:hypothetical protein
VIVPEPLIVLVLVVLSLTPVAPAVVVVVVEVSCAKAVLNATAPAAPRQQFQIWFVSYLCVALVKRTFFRLLVCDVSCPRFIQPNHQSHDTVHPRLSCFLRTSPRLTKYWLAPIGVDNYRKVFSINRSDQADPDGYKAFEIEKP